MLRECLPAVRQALAGAGSATQQREPCVHPPPSLSSSLFDLLISLLLLVPKSKHLYRKPALPSNNTRPIFFKSVLACPSPEIGVSFDIFGARCENYVEVRFRASRSLWYRSQNAMELSSKRRYKFLQCAGCVLTVLCGMCARNSGLLRTDCCRMSVSWVLGPRDCVLWAGTGWVAPSSMRSC